MFTSPHLTHYLSDFGVYSAIAHLCTACANIDFVHLCVLVHPPGVRVWSQLAHVASPPTFPACADEAVGRVFADEAKPEGPFCEYADEGHVQMGGVST